MSHVTCREQRCQLKSSAMDYRMSDRLSRLLELLRGGVSRKSVLALMTGHSLRTLKTLLQCLVEHGYIVSIKTDRNDWSWVPVESVEDVKADIATKVAASKQRQARRDAEKRKQRRAIPIPRGHGETVNQTVMPAAASRRIKRTAPATVWEFAQRSLNG